MAMHGVSFDSSGMRPYRGVSAIQVFYCTHNFAHSSSVF